MTRLLFVHSEVGGAHRAVAEALCEDLGERAEVEVVDLLEMASRFCNGSVKLYFPVMARWPRFYDWFYDVTGTRLGWEAVYRPFLRRLMIDRVAALLESRAPDCVVSLYALTSRIVVDAWRRSGRRHHPPLAVLLVDPYSLHRSWAEPGADLTLVPTEAARAQLLRFGIEARRTRLVRYPVRRAFRARGGDPPAMARLGAPRVLLMGGGDGLLDMPRLARALLALPEGLRVAAVPGRNPGVRRRLEATAAAHPGRLHIAAGWNEVAARMAAADLLVTKPGPSTLMEALEMELPLVLTGYVNRQEEGNVRWAEASGLGRWVEPRRVPETVRRLLGGTELQAMRQAARRQKEHRPSADAAGAILELAGAAREVCV